ncbi:MAG: hypothetical protein QOE61_2561 [Micromonosporaceae bacterium]|nr:hypothetical protein [Micromonosporaceae bacterium]
MSRAQGGSDAAGLTDEEFDRLADYLADALEPPDAAEVYRLVAEDPRWSTAHAALAEADAAVREILAGPIYAVGPMPADIAARLDDALRDVARTSHPSVTDMPTPRVSSTAGLGSVTSSATRSSATRSSPAGSSLAAARAKRRRFVTGIAAAAAAAVAIVGGLVVSANLFDRAQQSTAAPQSAVDGAGAPSKADVPAPSAAAAPTEPVLLASGSDYSLTTLDQLSAPRTAFGVSPGVSAQDSAKHSNGIGPVPQAVREGAPEPLARLLDRAALSACLDAIRAINPGSVAAVDYARFAGSPALVVLVERGNTSTVVAVGPNCGRFGADQRGAAQIP